MEMSSSRTPDRTHNLGAGSDVWDIRLVTQLMPPRANELCGVTGDTGLFNAVALGPSKPFYERAECTFRIHRLGVAAAGSPQFLRLVRRACGRACPAKLFDLQGHRVGRRFPARLYTASAKLSRVASLSIRELQPASSLAAERQVRPTATRPNPRGAKSVRRQANTAR
jgi:hypothetical protein